ncbi:hypothetical protein O181_026282 [Austropuccinia psidii MF-1]|uniref:Uncharacterized protein n=1 Tax=Austropuccinia psidii MF-1 TaxID=1389203 RepID=A0A9Q3H0M9_9BASI|nr:hypothetical protein [Austropuccinia psidii MF-1]
MGDSIREPSDDDQDPKKEFLVEYPEETQLEIQERQFEAGIPHDTANKYLCKHTEDGQTFLVTPARGMEYINETSTYMTVLTKEYLDNHFPTWEKKLLPTKAKRFKSASGKMKFIGKIIKEIIIPHRKVNIRLNPEFVVLEDDHIQGFFLGTDYHRMYGIDISNCKNRHIAIRTNKEKEFSLHI